MERKTMGSFIAALRKANGMTQKALAERLNVSDKAVSRWERDENAPDLSLIPVIAEIFGVTADELLRGERADPSAGNPARAAEKREREIRRLAASVRSGFCIQSIISAGIALAGLVAAMILNFGFLRAYAGFFAACFSLRILTSLTKTNTINIRRTKLITSVMNCPYLIRAVPTSSAAASVS